MAELKHKLKASTLIESIIAMVIIVVCFSVAVMIYVSVLDSDKQRVKLKAIQMLNEEATRIKNEKNFIDEQKAVNNWIINKKVEHYSGADSSLYLLSLVVTDSTGKIIARRNELITE